LRRVKSFVTSLPSVTILFARKAQKRGLFALLFACLFSSSAAVAGFVIPYTLKLGASEHRELFTVLVFLPDQYRKQWGPTDDLWKLLPRNDHGSANRFAKAYLPRPYHWYLKQIEAHPELYGEDADKMLAALITHHGIDPNVGAVVVTEHRKLDQPIAMLRITAPDAEGVLPTNRQFLENGLNGELFPVPTLKFRWNDLALFRAEEESMHFDVTRAGETIRHLWPEGENVEFKNFAMKREYRGRLMHYLFQIVWSHQLFAFGQGTLGNALESWPDGTPLTASDRTHMGRRISHIWLGTYGETLMRFYRRLGFRVWRRLELPEWQKPIFLMRATVRSYANAIRRMKPPVEMQLQRKWLVPDEEMTQQIQRFSCGDKLALGL